MGEDKWEQWRKSRVGSKILRGEAGSRGELREG